MNVHEIREKYLVDETLKKVFELVKKDDSPLLIQKSNDGKYYIVHKNSGTKANVGYSSEGNAYDAINKMKIKTSMYRVKVANFGKNG